MPCEATMLADVELFEHLNDDDRTSLAAAIDVRQLAAGDTLFKAGEPGEALYVVRSGEVELFIKDTAGQRIALSDVELLELDRDDLLLLFQRSPAAALRLLAAMGRATRKADELLKTRVSRNVNEEVEEHLSPLQRAIDWISWFSGSLWFLAFTAIWFTAWIVLNMVPLGVPEFDPYPFGLLTMITSLEAIFLSCFVLISQNRQAEKDRVRSDIEYEVNIKAELEVAHLHEKTDRIHAEMLEHVIRIEKRLAARDSAAA